MTTEAVAMAANRFGLGARLGDHDIAATWARKRVVET
jgi:uncharacterized protein (DUF1800 family)